MNPLTVLIVEDDPQSMQQLAETLREEHCQVTECDTTEKALQMLQDYSYDLVLTDLHTDGLGELHLLSRIKECWPSTVVIIITGSTSIERAVEAMRRGAFDYLSKPYNLDKVRAQVQKAREKVLLQYELDELRDFVKDYKGPQLIGKSHQIQQLKRMMARVGPLDCTVLLRGETGTGKELVSKLIHHESPRADSKFLAINCGSFTEELLANELFGHEKDAYTGARGLKKGIFEALDGGTVLLDEIGDMPYPNQIQLLRVLQEKTIIRVGGTEEIPVDVRVIAATNRGLRDAVSEGTFREDLYFRLNVFTLRIPPLRDRSDDIPLFCHHFLEQYAAMYKKPLVRISDEVMSLFMNYDFPGNVRELKNIIERAVVIADGQVIELEHLPQRFQRPSCTLDSSFCLENPPSLAEVETKYIQDVLRMTEGNKSKAAEILGIDRVSLWRKLKKMGLEN